MTEVIKLAGLQITLTTTQNTVPTDSANAPSIVTPNTDSGGISSNNDAGGATCVRVLNLDPGPVLITVANAGVNVGTFTLASNTHEYVRKYAWDTLQSNNGSNTFAVAITLTH